MNNFYTIDGGIPCKETKNRYPQVLKPIAPKGSELYKKITNLRNKSNPDAKGLIIELELDPKTNPTDFISQSWIGSIGLLVSIKTYEFLLDYNLQPEMEIYKAIIHHKGKTHDYVWLNPILDYDICIDFEKTKFFLFDFFSDTKDVIEIKDEKDLNMKSMQYNPMPIIVTDNLITKNKDLIQYDMFLISIGSVSIKVSEHLKNELEQCKFTALEFGKALPFSF